MPDRQKRRKSSRNVELSSLFTFRLTKVSTVTGIGGVVVAKPRTVVTFGLVSVLRVSKVLSLLDSSRVVASQKCQQSGSWSRNPELSFWTRLGSSRLKSVNSHRDRGGRGRETQNCRHFWTCLGCSRLKSVNSHRDRGGRGRETQNCRHFWTRLGSSRFKSVVTFGLVSGRRVSKASTVRVVVAKPRTVVLDSSRVIASQKCQQSQGSGGRGRETQNCRHFWPRLWREERREEKGEKKDERREERREERGEEREERRERKEREERLEERREKRGEKREEREGEREERGGGEESG